MRALTVSLLARVFKKILTRFLSNHVSYHVVHDANFFSENSLTICKIGDFGDIKGKYCCTGIYLWFCWSSFGPTDRELLKRLGSLFQNAPN